MSGSSRNLLGYGFLILFLVPFFAVGFGTMGYGLYLVGRGHSSGSWPVVEGVVTHSGTREETDSEGRRSLHPDIHYAYEWQGRKLECKEIRLGGDVEVNGQTINSVEDLRNYPVGKIVGVHVDPNHPEKALLEPGIAWMMAIFMMGFGVVFGGMASLFLVAGIKSLRKVKAQAQKADTIDFATEQAAQIPAGVAWTPLGMLGTNVQTCQLRMRPDGAWQVMPTQVLGTATIGLAACGVVVIVFDVWLMASELGKAVSPSMKMGLPVVAAAFFVIAFLVKRGASPGASFLPAERLCRGVFSGDSVWARTRADVPFADVIGLQILSQEHRTTDDRGMDQYDYTSYQLNLVLKDFTRRGVMAHGDQGAIEKDADTLAQLLRVPLWKRL